MGEVYQEFDAIRKKNHIKEFRSKPVSRKYAFELPSIPAESDYLKVLYQFSEPSLPADLKGKTFSHVFGAQTNALELFLLKRKIMGPCWLKISNYECSEKPVNFSFN